MSPSDKKPEAGLAAMGGSFFARPGTIYLWGAFPAWQLTIK
jgi:hypothetical protein